MGLQWKVGAIVDSLRMGVREGILKLRELGADGFQVYVTQGEMHPDNFPPAKRREFKKFVADQGLEISALCGDFDWVRGFTDAEFNKLNVPRVKKCVDLARDLGTSIVTMHIGRLPEDAAHPAYQEALKTTIELAKYSEQRGVCLCTETGPEAPASLLKFLKQVPSKGVGVNYDPANLIMAGPFDHIGGVGVLKDYIRHTHAKDGVRTPAGGGQEVPLGEGSVAFPYYLAALDAAGYKGYLTIEREGGENCVNDVAGGIRYLKHLQEQPGFGVRK